MSTLMRFSRCLTAFKNCSKSMKNLCSINGVNRIRQNERLMHSKCVMTRFYSNVAAAVRQSVGEESFMKKHSSLETDRIFYGLEQDMRRFRKVTYSELDHLLSSSEKEGTISANQSLFLLNCCGRSLCDETPEKRNEIVHEMWDRLQALGAVMEIFHYNVLLSVYLQNKYTISPVEFLAKLEKNNIKPNRITFQRLVSQYCIQGDLDGASTILQHMKSQGMAVNENVFNSLITAHFKSNDEENAMSVIDCMRQAGVEPTNRTYAALMSGYAEKGNMEGVEKMMSEADANGIKLMSEDILRTIETSTLYDHVDDANKMLGILKVMEPSRRQILLSCIQLVSQNHAEIAYQVFLSSNRTVIRDDDDPKFGNFFIRALVKSDKPPDEVKKYIDDMNEKRIMNNDFSFAARIAYSLRKPEYALKVFESMAQSGFQIKPHYFWPAFCQYGEKKDKEGILKTLQKMNELSMSSDDSLITLFDYVLPALDGLVERSELQEILQKYQYSDKEINFCLLINLLKGGKMEEAIELAQQSDLMIVPGLVGIVINNLPVSNYLKFLELVKILHSKMTDGSDANILLSSLTEAAFERRAWNELEAILSALKEMKIWLPQNFTRQPKITKVSQETPKSISQLLKSVCPNSDFPASVERIREMSYDEIKNEVSRNNSYFAKSELMKKAAMKGNIEEAEQMKNELDAVGFSHRAVTYKMLTYMYAAHKKDLAMAKEYKALLDWKYPRSPLYSKTIAAMAILYIEQGNFEDALNLLEEHSMDKMQFLQDKELELNRASFIELILATHKHNNFEMSKKVFHTLIKNNYLSDDDKIVAASHYMKHFVESDIEDELVVEAYEDLIKNYKISTRLGELFFRLIKNEKPELLQKVVDMTMPIRGHDSTLMFLVSTLTECNQLNKARKVIQTSNLKRNYDSVLFYFNRLLRMNQPDAIKNLYLVMKDYYPALIGSMLSFLMKSYIQTGRLDDATDVLSFYEEEEIVPNTKTKILLANALRENNREVPFDVPSPEPYYDLDSRQREEMEVSSKSSEHRADEQTEINIALRNFSSTQHATKFIDLVDRTRQRGDEEFSNLVDSISTRIILPNGDKVNAKKCFTELLTGNHDLDNFLVVKRNMHSRYSGFINYMKRIIFLSYAENDNFGEMISYLERNPRELVRHYNFNGLKHLSEPHLNELYHIAKSLQHKRNRAIVMNNLWQIFFIKNSDEANKLLEKFPSLKNHGVRFICKYGLESRDEELLKRAKDFVKNNNVRSLLRVGTDLIKYYCFTSNVDKALEVVDELKNAGYQDMKMSYVAVNMLVKLLKSENRPIPWSETTLRELKMSYDKWSQTRGISSSSLLDDDED